MVKIDFPYYPGYSVVEIPDDNFMGVFDLPVSSCENTESAIIKKAQSSPIGCPALSDMVRGKKNILIVSDDHHRPTPIKQILPFIIDELHSAGIRNEQVEIIMALGSHRLMTSEEIRTKLGEEIVSNFRVSNHDWQNPDAIYYAGRVKPGIEVWVNRKMKEADFVLGLGRIMPIEVCGFTGGAKIVIPGLCGEKTNSDMHWVRVDIPQDQIIGRRDNPIREAIDHSALAAGLDAIFNVIVDGQGRIVQAVFGHPIEAHRRGAEFAFKAHGVEFPERPDIVVADGYPFDMEFWQVNKALDTAGLIVKKGGVIIMVSPCWEGFSCTHAEEITNYGYRTKEEVRQLFAQRKIKHLVVAVHMIQVAEATLEKGVSCILVTDGITKEDIRKVGFDYAPDAQTGLRQALTCMGKKSRVAVLRRAAEMLPIIPGQRKKETGKQNV